MSRNYRIYDIDGVSLGLSNAIKFILLEAGNRYKLMQILVKGRVDIVISLNF